MTIWSNWSFRVRILTYTGDFTFQALDRTLCSIFKKILFLRFSTPLVECCQQELVPLLVVECCRSNHIHSFDASRYEHILMSLNHPLGLWLIQHHNSLVRVLFPNIIFSKKYLYTLLRECEGMDAFWNLVLKVDH